MSAVVEPKDNAASAAPDQGYDNPKRWYLLGLLAFTYMVAVLDRKIIVIAAEPIKLEFGLSDTQLGFLTGTCFAMAYAIVGIPLGMLVDRVSRKNLLAGAVGIWSLFTALGGLMGSYWSLVATRMAVGAAEAPNNTTGYSLITDSFKWVERSRAMGIYSMGSAFGSLVGMGLGGYIVVSYGWRGAFFLAGIPGLILCFLLIFTVKEPLRRKADGAVADGSKAPPLLETVKFIWSQRSFVFLYGGFVLGAMTISGVSLWLPSFLVRIHQVPLADMGLFLGLTYGIAASSGGVLGGMLGDYVGKKTILNICPMVGAQMLVTVVCFIAMVFVDSTWMAFGLFAIGLFAHYAHHPPIYSLKQILVAPRMRGTMSAILLVSSNLIGFGLGPQVVGILSDYYATWAGTNSLQYAIATLVLVNLGAAACFFMMNKTLEADLKKVA